jgi:hypothetical protein
MRTDGDPHPIARVLVARWHRKAAMKVIPLRLAPLVLAFILGLDAGSAYACNDAPGKTAEQRPEPKSDRLQPFSDPLIFAELLVLGLAIIEEPVRATNPCYRYRRLGLRPEPEPL